VYALKQATEDAKPQVISKSYKFDGGVKITSCTMSRLKPTAEVNSSQKMTLAEERALPKKFIVAASTFDHCQVKVVNLVFHKEAFTFSDIQNNLMNCHVAPVGKIRLSKNFPRLMVSCGFEQDVYLKLWNVTTKSASDDEPAKAIHQLTTS